MKRNMMLVASLTAVCAAGCANAGQQASKQHAPSDPRQEITIAPTPGGAERVAKIRRIQALVVEGRAEMARGRDAQAEALFRKALALDNDGMAWLSLARISERHGRQAEALKAYHALVYADGWGGSVNSSPNTRLRYVLALLRSHQWPEAVAVYDKAMQGTSVTNGHPMFDLRFDPQDPDRAGLEAAAHVGVGITALSSGPADAEEQRSHLAAAVRLRPEWGLAQYHYGRSLEKAGRTTQALAAYRRAAAHDHDEIGAKAQAAYQNLAPAK